MSTKGKRETLSKSRRISKTEKEEKKPRGDWSRGKGFVQVSAQGPKNWSEEERGEKKAKTAESVKNCTKGGTE